MQELEITLEGKRFFYRETGEGPAVVLVHGFGEDGTVWSQQYDALPQYRVLIPDLPGSGRSGEVADMSIKGLSATLHAWLLKLGVERCTMIGHSMGGYITLAFAEQYPQALNAFGLFHSTAYGDTEEKKATRRKGIEFIKKNGAFEFLKTSIPTLYSDVTKKHQPKLIEQQIEASHDFSATALVRYYEAMMARPDRVHVLKASALPVLFLLGREDAAIPLKDGLEQCYLPDQSFTSILENSGHMGMREEVEKSNKQLLEFLAQLHH